ncbi:hypothetical protein ABIA39_006103 [Nocardia sp. GAS34]
MDSLRAPWGVHDRPFERALVLRRPVRGQGSLHGVAGHAHHPGDRLDRHALRPAQTVGSTRGAVPGFRPARFLVPPSRTGRASWPRIRLSTSPAGYFDSSAGRRPGRRDRRSAGTVTGCRHRPGVEQHDPTLSADDAPALPPRWPRGGEGDAGRFPRSSRTRSTSEASGSTPAASPRLRRRHSPWPPDRLSHRGQKFPATDRQRLRTAPSPYPPDLSWWAVKGRRTLIECGRLVAHTNFSPILDSKHPFGPWPWSVRTVRCIWFRGIRRFPRCRSRVPDRIPSYRRTVRRHRR